MRLVVLAVLVGAFLPGLRAQEVFSRKNTFTVFGEYSNDSSHIILGYAPNRRLAGVGGQYERRLVAGRYATLAYMAEFRPFVVSSDIVATYTYSGTDTFMGTTFPISGSNTGMVFSCLPGNVTVTGGAPDGSSSYSETITTTCGRENTLAQAGSPVGLRVNLRPGKRLQVMLSSNGGYMFATKPIPIPRAGSFNFTFNFGGGLEYYTSARRSVRVEYLVQHYSNKFTAPENPGVDSGFVRVGYAFGR